MCKVRWGLRIEHWQRGGCQWAEHFGWSVRWEPWWSGLGVSHRRWLCKQLYGEVWLWRGAKKWNINCRGKLGQSKYFSPKMVKIAGYLFAGGNDAVKRTQCWCSRRRWELLEQWPWGKAGTGTQWVQQARLSTVDSQGRQGQLVR